MAPAPAAARPLALTAPSRRPWGPFLLLMQLQQEEVWLAILACCCIAGQIATPFHRPRIMARLCHRGLDASMCARRGTASDVMSCRDRTPRRATGRRVTVWSVPRSRRHRAAPGRCLATGQRRLSLLITPSPPRCPFSPPPVAPHIMSRPRARPQRRYASSTIGARARGG